MLLASVGLAALISGCAQLQVQNQAARGEQGGLDVPYVPKPLPGTTTLESVRDDLTALLRGRARPVGIKFGSHAFTQIDINRRENLVQLVRLLREGVEEDNFTGLRYDNQQQLDYIPYKTVSVLDDRIELGPRIAFLFSEILNGPITVAKLKGGDYPYVIQLQNQVSFRFESKDLADAKRMADDLDFMKRSIAKQDEARAAQSAALVAQYRALKTKPPVSEEQRRFIVQANTFNQQKNYGQALEHYQKALDLQPLSYPAAYFNMALLSAQLNRFRLAIAYMKQYLLLEPEAKDARSAQDKIYEWEVMLGK